MRYLLAVVALVTAPLLVTGSTASASTQVAGAGSLPQQTTVGQNGGHAEFTVINTNTGRQSTESNIMTGMWMTPSCGVFGEIGPAVCSMPDPGVFALSTVATGDPDSTCAGDTFTISPPDANGTVAFTRQGGPLLVPPNGQCTFHFTFDVLKMPAIDADPELGGTQTWHTGIATGLSATSGTDGFGGGGGRTTVARIEPTLATTATGGVVGQPIADAATVTSGVPAGATGTVTFTLYGPGDTNCSGAPVATSANRPVNGSGVATSTNYVPSEPGNYRWRASYSGDANHDPIDAPCNEPNETSEVTPAPPLPVASGTRARGDFNGDGADDLVVGAPGEDRGAVVDAGVVHVLYGGASGVSAAGSQYWSQDSAGVADSAEAGDGFGSVLSAGDFNGDGRDDLAVGVPSEDVGAVGDGGVVHVIYGSATGLVATGSQLWSQNSGAVADTTETGDHFGGALAAGTLDNDSVADLVVGAPEESVGAITGAGIVHVILGGAGGLTATGSQTWTQNSGGIVDSAETGDGFGTSLAVGASSNEAAHFLAIGVPSEDVGAVVDGGVVHVIYELAAPGAQYWSQNSGMIADTVEADDRFGSALAVGTLNDDAFVDLVVGVPDESVGAITGAGLVHVIHSDGNGLSAIGSQSWSQNSGGIVDSAETSDGFGASLAVGDMGNSAEQDLAIGVPAEDIGAVVDGGVVHVLYGSAASVTATGAQYWSQNSAMIADSVEAGDHFGSAVAIGPLGSDAFAELVVGVPDESVGAIASAGQVHVIAGGASGLTATGSQLWTQDSAGIADSVEAGDGFGAALGA